MLNEVAEGVWVRQSEWVWTNSMVVRADDGLVLIDPGITGAELAGLADDLEELEAPIVAGFSTHPHWDHLLWHERFGDPPRYATTAGCEFATETVELQREGAKEEGGPDIPFELIALTTPLPADGGPIPGELIEHNAHAPGHAAIYLEDRGVLLAADMFSDVLIPLFDPRQENQLDAYEEAFELLQETANQAEVMVPGHGSVAKGSEVADRVAADRAYVKALRKGNEPADPRLEIDWMSGPHQGNLNQIRDK